MLERGDPVGSKVYMEIFRACLHCEDRSKAQEVADQVWTSLKADGFHFSGDTLNRQKTLTIVYNMYMKVLRVGGLERQVFDVSWVYAWFGTFSMRVLESLSNECKPRC